MHQIGILSIASLVLTFTPAWAESGHDDNSMLVSNDLLPRAIAKPDPRKNQAKQTILKVTAVTKAGKNHAKSKAKSEIDDLEDASKDAEIWSDDGLWEDDYDDDEQHKKTLKKAKAEAQKQKAKAKTTAKAQNNAAKAKTKAVKDAAKARIQKTIAKAKALKATTKAQKQAAKAKAAKAKVKALKAAIKNAEKDYDDDLEDADWTDEEDDSSNSRTSLAAKKHKQKVQARLRAYFKAKKARARKEALVRAKIKAQKKAFVKAVIAKFRAQKERKKGKGKQRNRKDREDDYDFFDRITKEIAGEENYYDDLEGGRVSIPWTPAPLIL